MIYTHVLGRGARSVSSPLDAWTGAGVDRMPGAGAREMPANWNGNGPEVGVATFRTGP